MNKTYGGRGRASVENTLVSAERVLAAGSNSALRRVILIWTTTKKEKKIETMLN